MKLKKVCRKSEYSRALKQLKILRTWYNPAQLKSFLKLSMMDATLGRLLRRDRQAGFLKSKLIDGVAYYKYVKGIKFKK